MAKATGVPSTPPTNVSATCPTDELPNPVGSIASLRLNGSERELLAALLGYIVWGLEYGRTFVEMETAAFQELELARRSAEQNRRRALRCSQLKVAAIAKKPREDLHRARAIRNQFLAQVRGR